jgi:hypothetical protein
MVIFWSDDAQGDRLDDRLLARIDVEFLANVSHVKVDGRL